MTLGLLGLLLASGSLASGVVDAYRPHAASAHGATPPPWTDNDAGGLPSVDAVAAAVREPDGDLDADGLNNAAELGRRTDLTDPDSDGDGLPDGVEVAATDALPGADPLRADVYVEVDYRQGCQLSVADRERIRIAFADAPVSNPGGEPGIALHLVRDEAVRGTDPVPADLLYRYAYEYRDRAASGYHYVLLAPARGYNEKATSLVTCGHPGVFVHELGHSLGLREEVAPGIDAHTVAFDDYPSAMSYEAPPSHLDYSDGSRGADDHDDWGYLARAMETPSAERLCGTVNATTDACGEAAG